MKAKIIGSAIDLAASALSDIKVGGVEIHTGMSIEVFKHSDTLDGIIVYKFYGTYVSNNLQSWLIRSSLLEIIEE